MNKQKLVDLLKNPSTIDARQIGELEEIIKQNPYFQPGYALLAVGRKIVDPKKAKVDITKAAIYATNRVFLKKYLENAIGGAQASTASDAVLEKESEKRVAPATAEREKPSAAPEKTVPPTDSKELKPVPKEEAAPPKPKYEERFHDKEEKTRLTIQKREEEKPDAQSEPTTRPKTEIDLDKILNELRSEVQMLQVNMKSFDKAEKDLSEAEIREKNAEKPSPEADSIKKTTPKAETKTAKTATAPSKSATKKTKTTKTTDSTKTKSSAKPKAVKTTAKKSSGTSTTSKASGTKTKSATPSQAKSGTATKKSTTKGGKIKLESSDSDDDLLASEGGSLKKKEQKKLIDKFIEAEPRIVPKKNTDKGAESQEDLALKNQVLTDDMVTENLAAIMIKQGRIEKAIEIYNKLIWKFPHKKTYFAGRIEELKEQ